MAEPAIPEVVVRVPGLLARFTDGAREIEVEAETAGGAIDRLLDAYPALEPHLVDGRGELREHVILFVDGKRVAWSDRGSVELENGAAVTVMQAVSGGDSSA